jgi:hypothetical protein
LTKPEISTRSEEKSAKIINLLLNKLIYLLYCIIINILT